MGLVAQQRRDPQKARNLSELVRKGESLAVVSDISAEALVSSGVILRALRTLGVDFEFYLTTDPVDPAQLSVKVIGVEAYIQGCANCVELAEPRPRKTPQHVFHAALSMVREVVPPSREEYVLLLSSALTKYTPRSLASGFSPELQELVSELQSSGVIREVLAPRLMGWGAMPLEEVVRYSIDTCVLKYFGKPVGRVTESDIVRELRVDSIASLEDKTYVPNYEAGVLDLYEAAYVIEYAVDAEGPEYVAFMPLNYSYFLWAVRAFRASVEAMRECLDTFLEKSFELEGGFYVMECDTRASGTVLTKILRGLKLIEDSASVVYRTSDGYYVPLQLLSRPQRAKLSGSEVRGGYAILDRSSFLKLQKP